MSGVERFCRQRPRADLPTPAYCSIRTNPPLTPLALSLLISRSSRSAHAAAFAQSSFTCGICLDARKGAACLALVCGCVFCAACLGECWALAIREGAVGSVGCPSAECTKRRVLAGHARVGGCGEGDEGSGAAPGQDTDSPPALPAADPPLDLAVLERVVGTPLRERFEWLREKQRVENDPSYTLCPMAHCQAAVPPSAAPSATARTSASNVFRLSKGALSDGASAQRSAEDAREAKKRDEDRWDRFRQCPTCQFCFCRYCMQTWWVPIGVARSGLLTDLFLR